MCVKTERSRQILDGSTNLRFLELSNSKTGKMVIVGGLRE